MRVCVCVCERERERERMSSTLRSCVKVEVNVLGSLSLIVLMVSVDLKQYLKKKKMSCRGG